MNRFAFVLGLGVCLGTIAQIAAAQAQGLNLGGGPNRQPIEIQASEGIEWHREEQRYIARGDARATQGTTTVAADVLTAYYRAKPAGGNEIFRLEATGRTRISTPTEQATADKAVYDVDSGVLVLTGRNLKATTQNGVITARDSLEYWEKRQLMVARGDALAISEDKRMKADILTAYFVPNDAAAPRPAAPSAASPAGSQRIERVEGFGNLHVSTATEVARAERGVYHVRTGIATLAGSVKITQGDNQLNGDYAEVNLNTGVSKLMSRPQPGTDGRVRGLIVPQERPESPAPASPPAARPQR